MIVGNIRAEPKPDHHGHRVHIAARLLQILDDERSQQIVGHHVVIADGDRVHGGEEVRREYLFIGNGCLDSH